MISRTRLVEEWDEAYKQSTSSELLQYLMRYFIFITILYGALAAVKQCDMVTRPVVCPALYAPVCGTKTDGSKQTYDNYCAACADANVAQYSEGSGCNEQVLPISPIPLSSSYTYCQKLRPQMCTLQYRPVCGIKKIGEPATYGNGCGACSDKDVVAWVSGQCSTKVKTCTGNQIDCSAMMPAPRASCGFNSGAPYTDIPHAVCCLNNPYSQILPMKCPTAPQVPPTVSFTKCGPYKPDIACIQLYQPVCGLLKDGSYKTQGNSCTACTDINVVGYTPGECADTTPIIVDPTPIIDPLPPTTEGKFTMCPPGPRQQGCNKMYLQTCGFKYKGLPSNYGNTCMACGDSNVFGYIVGDCSELVKTCSADRVDCRLIKTPSVQSCAFQKGKAPYNVNDNLCCKDSTYDQVITGVCPTIYKQAKINFCYGRPITACTKIYKPVCASLKNKTHRTFANSCEACNDRSVISYVEGQC